jgi:N-acetyl-beta-hexosaminidase
MPSFLSFPIGAVALFDSPPFPPLTFRRFFHLGADEVDTDCYLTEEGWTRRLREAGLPLERSAVERLLFTFLRGASGVLARGGKRALAWADMVFASGDLNADNRSFAALEVWREPGDLSLIAAARRPVLLAADNYLDHLDAVRARALSSLSHSPPLEAACE